MATISVARQGQHHRVAIRGTLRARDLKRLEHACRDALQYERLPLELDVQRATVTDDTARTYLRRLQARGARLVGVAADDDTR